MGQECFVQVARNMGKTQAMAMHLKSDITFETTDALPPTLDNGPLVDPLKCGTCGMTGSMDIKTFVVGRPFNLYGSPVRHFEYSRLCSKCRENYIKQLKEEINAGSISEEK